MFYINFEKKNKCYWMDCIVINLFMDKIIIDCDYINRKLLYAVYHYYVLEIILRNVPNLNIFQTYNNNKKK